MWLFFFLNVDKSILDMFANQDYLPLWVLKQ